MRYACPQRYDFNEARDLNRAFLGLLRAESSVASSPESSLDGAEVLLLTRLRQLSAAQVERLARVPLLLLSFREQDRELWERSPGEERVAEPEPPAPADDSRARLLAAGLGFAWQLARRNPYTLRLLSGASLHWCECLAEQPFLAVMHRVRRCTDLPRLRAAGDTELWRKLLSDGVSRHDRVRAAAHLSSLQMRLTQPAEASRWSSAACRTRLPALTLRRDP